MQEGLSKGSRGNAIYLNLYQGAMVRQVKEPIEGETVSRPNKKGVTVHEIPYKEFVGKLTKVEKEATDYGYVLRIHLLAAGTNHILTIPYSGRISLSFLTRIRNADLSKHIQLVTFRGKAKDGTDKEHDVLLVNQHDGAEWVLVKPFYTKDEPKGLPPMVQIPIKGVPTWDDTDQMAYLQKHVVEDWLAPKLRAIQEARIKDVDQSESATATKEVVETARGIEVVDNADDLPF